MTNITTLLANMRKAARNQEQTTIGGGIFSAKEMKALADQIEDLLDAACNGLPFVEDNLNDPGFKPGSVMKTADQIRKAITNAGGR